MGRLRMCWKTQCGGDNLFAMVTSLVMRKLDIRVCGMVAPLLRLSIVWHSSYHSLGLSLPQRNIVAVIQQPCGGPPVRYAHELASEEPIGAFGTPGIFAGVTLGPALLICCLALFDGREKSRHLRPCRRTVQAHVFPVPVRFLCSSLV